MRKKLKKIVAYVFRNWINEPGYTHPRSKILPPFFFEIISYLIALFILYQIVAYLWKVTANKYP